MTMTPDPVRIRSMFDKISSRYDVLNSLLSFRTHWIWKNRLVEMGMVGLSEPRPQILDCATGTADIAQIWLEKIGPTAHVTATDFSDGMLEVARKRHQGRAIAFQWADVQKLPFADCHFDRATISFGIRNVENPTVALMELSRVVKPDGKVLILEFGQPTLPVFSSIYKLYSKSVLPLVGGLVSGERSAYRYLEASSAQFPCGDAFLAIARATGQFSRLESKSLMGGIAWIYDLTKRSSH